MTALDVEPDAAPAPVRNSSGEWLWSIAGWVGLLLAIGGVADLVLPWFPAHPELPDWRFGVVAEGAAALPSTALGVALLTGAAIARGRRGVLRVAGALTLLLSVLLAVVLVLFARDAHAVLRDVRGQDPTAILSLRRVLLKTYVSLILLAPGLLVAALTALHASFARHPAKP